MPHRDLHMDEGLHARGGIEVGVRGNLLMRGIWNDRPLVFSYLLGACYRLFGVSQQVSYLPNLVASALLLLCLYRVTARLYTVRAGLLVAGLAAGCPLLLVYAPSVFVEPVTVLFALLSAEALLLGRPAVSGLLFGLAAGTKQLAPAFAPLLGGLLLATSLECGRPIRIFARWLAGASLLLLPMWIWSNTVQQPHLGAFWIAGRPEALDLSLEGLGSRAAAWIGLVRERILFDSTILGGLSGLALVAFGIRDLRAWRRRPNERPRVVQRLSFTLLALWFLGVLATGRLPHWDRYAYPLIPFLLISLGAALDEIGTRIRPRWLGRAAIVGLLALAALPASSIGSWIPARLHLGVGGPVPRPTYLEAAAAVRAVPGPAPAAIDYDDAVWRSTVEFYFQASGASIAPKRLAGDQDLRSYLLEAGSAAASRVLISTRSATRIDRLLSEDPELSALEPAVQVLHRAYGATVYRFPGRQACLNGAADVTALGLPLASVPVSRCASAPLSAVADGVFPPLAHWDPALQFNTCLQEPNREEVWTGYLFPAELALHGLLYQEGIHFDDGGWLETFTVSALTDAGWAPIRPERVIPAYRGAAARNFEVYCVKLPEIRARGIRVSGRAGGHKAFVSVGELRVFGHAPTASRGLRLLNGRPAADAHGIGLDLRRRSVVSAVAVDAERLEAGIDVQLLDRGHWRRMEARVQFEACAAPSGLRRCETAWIAFDPAPARAVRILPASSTGSIRVRIFGAALRGSATSGRRGRVQPPGKAAP
jgi:hypothetical protein